MKVTMRQIILDILDVNSDFQLENEKLIKMQIGLELLEKIYPQNDYVRERYNKAIELLRQSIVIEIAFVNNKLDVIK